MRGGPARRPSRATVAALGSILAVALAAGAAAAGSGSTTRAAGPIVAGDYDLGVRTFAQPGLTGKFSHMPIRLWGTVAAPAGSGPHPVIVVAHGAHGDNCPGEFGTWPCWKVEKRNDLGFRYLVRSLARAGFVAVAPDLNAAHTGGWGEGTAREGLRFSQVVDATLAELARANRGGGSRFGIALKGKLDLASLGLLGHSRGGMNVLDWSRGKKAVQSVFLLAPFHDPAKRIGNVPTTLLLGTCDGDTRLEGAKYFAALRGKARTAPAYQVKVAGANHNYYNQTLVREKADDAAGSTKPGCGQADRMSASAQQTFLTRLTRDHFRVAQLGANQAAWMKPPSPKQLYGEEVTVQRIAR